jgi:hypothetical protein
VTVGVILGVIIVVPVAAVAVCIVPSCASDPSALNSTRKLEKLVDTELVQVNVSVELAVLIVAQI